MFSNSRQPKFINASTEIIAIQQYVTVFCIAQQTFIFDKVLYATKE